MPTRRPAPRDLCSAAYSCSSFSGPPRRPVFANMRSICARRLAKTQLAHRIGSDGLLPHFFFFLLFLLLLTAVASRCAALPRAAPRCVHVHYGFCFTSYSYVMDVCAFSFDFSGANRTIEDLRTAGELDLFIAVILCSSCVLCCICDLFSSSSTLVRVSSRRATHLRAAPPEPRLVNCRLAFLLRFRRSEFGAR